MKVEQIFEVKGTVALVTGAASGLGLAYAEVMAANGAKVAMVDRDEEGLAQAATSLRDAGGEVTEAVVDVTSADDLLAAIDNTVAAHGQLDAVFANAGITSGPSYRHPVGEVEAIDPALWQKVLDINLTSVFNTIQGASKHMKKQGSGRIVVTASVAGLGSDDMVGYGYIATKAAVINLVRQAAHELAPFNVLINAIAPGPFFTNIAEGRLKDPGVVEQFSTRVPLGRLAHTDEIKGLALLLASPASSYITGTVIPIDGGINA